MAVTTYEEVARGRVLKGVEKLLEAEFGSQDVLLQRLNPTSAAKRFIRIWNIGTEFLGRPAGAVVDRYTVEVVTFVPPAKGRRKQKDTAWSLAARAKRILTNKTAYSVSGTYKWHNGSADELEEDGENVRFIYAATVQETGLD